MAIDPGNDARRKLLERERAQALRTVVEFKKIQARIADELRDVLERIEKTRRTDGNATPGQLMEQARLRALFDQVSDEIFSSSVRLGLDTSNLQRRAIDIAKDQAGQVAELKADLDFFDGPATRQLIGIAGDGEPLAKHFANIAKPVRQQIFDALFYGVATGKPNSIIAQEINNAIGGGAARAMHITRTETNRAYREASRKFYADVPSVVGWRWLAALDLTTCPICWSMHGRIFKTKTPFGTHVSCRCTMVPAFRGDAKVESGSAQFGRLTIEQQRAIVGPKRLELYNQGAELSDFVALYRSAFGPSRRLKGLEEIKFSPSPRTPAGSASGPPRSAVKIPELKTPDAALSSIAPRPGDPVPLFSGPDEATAYMEKRYPTTGFDFGGMTRDGDILQKNAKEVARLMDLYPEAGARLKYFGTYDDPKKIPRRSGGKFPGAYGHCAHDGSYIALNPAYYGNRQKVETAKRVGLEKGWSVSDKLESTTTHEFGHAIEGWINSKYNKSVFEFETNDGKALIGHIKDAIGRKFKPKIGEQSDYSLENKKEQFAEGFSMFWNRPAGEHSRYTIAQAKLIKLAQDSTAALDAEAIPWHKLSDTEQRAARKRVNDLYIELGLKPPYAKKLL